VWNVNDTFIGDILQFFFGWSYDPLKPGRFEKSVIGGIVADLFGWNDNPTLIEVVAYILYHIFIILIILQIKPSSKEKEQLTIAH